MLLVGMLFYCLLVEIIVVLHLPQVFTQEDLTTPSPNDLTTTIDYLDETTPLVVAAEEEAEEEEKEVVVSRSIEILEIFLPPGIGNAVKLVWGHKLDDLHLNMTYGVHYAKEDENLSTARFTTPNMTATIEDLDFCTKYNFAVTVSDAAGASAVTINPNDIRSLVTYLDANAAPKDLQVDFEPRDIPCLMVKWSASCASVGRAIGYVISAFEKNSARYKIVTLPESKKVDFIYHLKVNYGEKFDIKVSTNFPGSQATDTVTYKVPNFLQPYKVRITSNPDGAFMIYWSEPFVPYYIDRVYYEVYIYRGVNISSNYEKYYVTRPVLIYKGNESLYTFSIGLVSYDGQYRSKLTPPIIADLYGEVHELNPDD